MNAELRLSYEPDDEWHGELKATVVSGAFAGKGTAWFNRETLETFANSLRAFPLDPSNAPLLQGGFWDGRAETLTQCHLRVAVRPYDVLGTLLVQVDCATPSWSSPEPDQQQLLTARFVTEYALLDRFATEFLEHLDGRREAAALGGTAG
jgi:hypothetical protein